MMHSSAKRALLIVLFASSSLAHTYLSSVYLNGEALNEGDCVRPHPASQKEYPIPLVTAPDMTCGWLPAAANSANRKCPIAAGSTLGIQWHHNTPDASDFILDPTHKGPIQVYLAKSESGAGDVWFKIFEDGYTPSDGQWATDRMLENHGRVDVTIPIDITPGNYLLRGEILALHNAYDVNGVQPYIGCVELTISGSGSSSPAGVAFPGYYSPSSPGLVINIYNPISSYPIPGPTLYLPGPQAPTLRPISTPWPTSPPTAQPTPTTPPSPPTYQPTPTTHPTLIPTPNPTSRPTTRPTPTPTPTNRPHSTQHPTPTTRPTSVPTPAPTTYAHGGDTLKLQLSGGSGEWWLGVVVSGVMDTVVRVEMTDSDSVDKWTSLVDLSYAYVFSEHTQLSLPISLRITASTEKRVTLPDVITSWSTELIDTGRTFSE